MYFSLTDLSTSTLALVRGFEVIPGGTFHALVISEIKKENFKIELKKTMTKLGCFSHSQPEGSLVSVRL